MTNKQRQALFLEAYAKICREYGVHVGQFDGNPYVTEHAGVLAELMVDGHLRSLETGGGSDDLPPVRQSPIEKTVLAKFVDAGRHEPLPFPEG